MKIYAFEVRDDEVNYFNELKNKLNIEIELSPEKLTNDVIPTLAPGSAVSVLGMCRYDGESFRLMSQRDIKYLSTRTIGFNHIDLESAKSCGIHVCNAYYAPDGVAEYTIMMMLLCLRRYKQALWRIQVNDYSLGGLIGRQLKDMTVGIIGTGSIGSAVAKVLTGFGCRVLAWSRHQNPELSGIAEYVPLEELYRECDIITLHLALNEDTYHIINDESIGKMKKGVIIINCARGGLMDMESLIANIENEQIGALGIDCYEHEEDIVHRDRKNDIFSDREIAYLRQFKNVVYTQHMAFYTEAAVRSMVECGVCGIMQMSKGERCSTQLV